MRQQIEVTRDDVAREQAVKVHVLVLVLALVLVAACGDNIDPIAPPLAPSDVVFFAAHPDDEMIFMQPAVLDALPRSLTVIYATTAGAKGVDQHLYDSTMVAYGKEVAAFGWDCGALDLGVGTVQHCRLRDLPISIVNLDLADGGIPGDGNSLLHLVDGTLDRLALAGPRGGTVAVADITTMFAAVLTATQPKELHTLDLAATHGRDHSSHLFVASFVLWASAELGLTTSTTWHRGYNVEPEVPTLSDAGLASAQAMLGYYEACADGRPCGPASMQVLPEHAIWLARQYATSRVVTASGKLASADGCFGDCATAWTLASNGALIAQGQCLTSAMDGSARLAPCNGDRAQYWVLDGEGHLWNGLPPLPGGDMSMDHVRCLTTTGTPTCGAHLAPVWAFTK